MTINQKEEEFLSKVSQGSSVQEITDLLAEGVNINVISEDGETALYNAVVRGDIRVVELLLNHSADPNLRNENDQQEYPLHQAVYHGKDQIVKLLLKHKADPNVTDRGGQPPLHHIFFTPNHVPEIVQSLLSHGVTLNFY